ncbi:hypothetical protein EMCRGX_G018903 [Ephydatia muelleri]
MSWSSSAQSINVSITLVTTGPIPADQNLPLPYTLNCTATSTPGSPTNVTWITPPAPAGMMGPLTTSGSTSSRILTLSSPVLLSYAGLYVCNASANGMSRTASYAFNVSVRTSTLPPVTVTSTPSSPNYQGSMLTLMCSFGITSPNLGLTSIKWVGPAGLPLVPDGRVSILTYTSTLYTSNLTISSLSRKDGGLYTCTPAIGPKPPSPYVIDFTQETSSSTVTINDLTLGVAVSPSNLRSSSNSFFQINCTATKPPSVLLPFVFSWSWNDSYTGSVLTFNSSGVTTIGGTTFVMTQPPGVTNSTPTVTSTLIVSQPLPGVYYYRCDVMVSVPIDGPVNQTAIASISISGPPNRPTNVMGKYVSNTTATIQWMVPFIAYTRETYVVHYGSAPDNLNQSSILVNGSADLNVTGTQFGVNLTGLVPYSLYYYTIEASNTEGTTTTPVMTLSFFPRTSNGALAALVVIILPIAIVAMVIARPIYFVVVRKKSNKSEQVTLTSISQQQDQKGSSNKSEQVTPTSISQQQDQKGSSDDSGTNFDAVDKPESGMVMEAWSDLSMVTYSSNAVEEHLYDDPGKTTEDQLATQPIPDPEKIGKMTEVQLITQPILLKDLEKTIDLVGSSWNSVWEQHSSQGWTNIEEMNLHMKPGDSSRGAMLPYGNAIFINGYDGSPNAYIAAQAPLQNTVEDFWRMVLGVECTTIVVLYSLSEHIDQFWPSTEQQTYAKMRVSINKSVNEAKGVYQLEVTDDEQQKVVKVTLYHYIGSANEEPGNGWPECEHPKDEHQFCAFCNEVQTKGHVTPIVVMCNNGVGRTGTFITILAMLEMAKREGKVDMVQIITSIRARCPVFIPDVEHLRLCYDTVLYWHKFE